jgi:hypothetical protein
MGHFDEVKLADIAARLGQENYDYFVMILDSEEELLRRVSTVSLGKLAYPELKKKLDVSLSGLLTNSAEGILEYRLSVEREIDHVGFPDKVKVMCLSAEDFGISPEGGITLESICSIASEYGLGVCPTSLAPYLLLSGEAKLDRTNDYLMAMDPVPFENNADILGVRAMSSSNFVYSVPVRFTTGFSTDTYFFFCLPSRGEKPVPFNGYW